VRQVALVTVGFLMGAAGVVMAIGLWPRPAEFSATTEPVFASVTVSEEALRRNASVELVLADPIRVVAAGAKGRVTSVDVSPGDSLVSGEIVFVVGGVRILAEAAPAPFWRKLKRGDTGDDVAMLQCILAERGFYSGACDGSFGGTTLEALIAYNQAIGIGSSAIFDPAFVLWLPMQPMVVARVDVEVGSWFAAQGEVVLTSEQEPIAVSLRLTGGVESDLARFGDLAFVLNVGGSEIPVAADLAVNMRDVIAVVDVAAAIASRSSPEDEPNDSLLSGNKLVIKGALVGSKEFRSLSVPTAAIVESSGRLCVFVKAGFAPAVVLVTPVGSSITGSTFVEADLRPGQQVVLNPTEAGLLSCS